MLSPKRGQIHVLAAGFLLGALLLLSCQPAQPAATPKTAEKAAATPTKPAEKGAEKPSRGGTLRLVAVLDPDSLDAHATTNYLFTWQSYDALFWQNQDLDVTKDGLAKDWAISADGKTMTLKLREGIKFHDGTGFDAAAVKFNIERVKDPATKSPYRSDYAKVSSVEVVDLHTVRLNLSAPDPLLLPAMAAKGGQMVSPAAVKKYGQDFGRNPVGTGPFQFVEWVSSDHIALKRFEGYWKKDKDGNQLPYLDGVVHQLTSDVTVAFNNLRAGQSDVYRGVVAEQLPTLKGDTNLNYTARAWTVVNGAYLNTKKAPFDNKALRQAVALALDRQGIADRMGERATLLASVLHPMTWAYDEKAAQFPARDLSKAKAKLAEAGYANGLKIAMPTQNTAEGQLTAQILKANLAEIGVEAEIEVLASVAHTTRVRNEQNYGLAPPSSSGLGLADPGYILGLAFHSKGGRNYYGPYGNPQVDQLLDKAGSIYDQKERTALYQQAANMIADDVPFIPTHSNNNFNGLGKKVRGYVQYADDFPRLYDVWMAP